MVVVVVAVDRGGATPQNICLCTRRCHLSTKLLFMATDKHLPAFQCPCTTAHLGVNGVSSTLCAHIAKVYPVVDILGRTNCSCMPIVPGITGQERRAWQVRSADRDEGREMRRVWSIWGHVDVMRRENDPEYNLENGNA